MTKKIDVLLFSDKNIEVSLLFRSMLYFWVILNYSLLIFNAEVFWGNYVFFNRPVSSLDGYFIYDLFPRMEAFPYVYPLLTILIAIAGLLLFLKSRMVAFLLLYLVFSLDHKSYVILDGGNNLSHFLLFYNCFFSFNRGEANNAGLSLLTSNLALYACRFQVVLVYTVAGLTKVTGSLWVKGVALYYVFNTEPYASEWMSSFSQHCHEFFIVVPTYSVLLFQISFPFLIWLESFKRALMIFGVIIHLNIVFLLGLISFGLVMCASYACFFNKSEAESVINFILKKRALLIRKVFLTG